jgi:hypothetical protein
MSTECASRVVDLLPGLDEIEELSDVMVREIYARTG